MVSKITGEEQKNTFIGNGKEIKLFTMLFLIDFIKKLRGFFYDRFYKKTFLLFSSFTGIILSTSHLGDNYMGISDEEGYLLTIGICCLTAFFFEYLLPKIKK